MGVPVWRIACPFRAIFLALILTSGLSAAEQRIELREYVGQDWQEQLLTYPFAAGEGECHPASAQLEGPQGPMAVQLIPEERWPGTEFVKSGQVAFLTDLPPFTSHTFTLRYGPEAAPVDPATDLQVQAGEGQVELTTSRFGVRLLLGEQTYAEPVPAAEVPGPVLALRLADGTWFGGSRMWGEGRLRSWQAELTGAGPVFGEVRAVYTWEDGHTLTLTVRLPAGADAAFFDTEVSADRPQEGWDLVLSPGLPPLVFHVQMEFFTSRRVFLDRNAQVGDWAQIPLAEHAVGEAPTGDPWQEPYAPGTVINLTPWEDWWDDYTRTLIRLELAGTGSELRLHSRDAAAWVEPAPPAVNPGSGPRRHKNLPLMLSEEREVYLRVSNAAGVRRWAVSHEVQPGPEPTSAYYQPPLNAVKDYVLEWPEDPQRRHPFIYVSREEMQEYRERNPVPEDRLQEMIRGAAGAMRRDPLPAPGYWERTVLLPYLLSGTPEVAEETRVPDLLRNHLGLLGAFMKQHYSMTVVDLYDALIDSDLVSAEERIGLRAQMAYLGYALADPGHWSVERGYTSGNPNMSVMNLMNLAMVACALAGHPMVEEWFASAKAYLEDFLTNEVGPQGEWIENSHYMTVSMAYILPLALAARNAGLVNWVDDDRFKRALIFQAKHYHPPDPRFDGERRVVTYSRSCAGAAYALPGIMARAVRDADPTLSAHLQWIWKHSGRSSFIHSNNMTGFETFFLDPDLPAEPPAWGSEHNRDFVLLLHGYAQPEEHYLFNGTPPGTAGAPLEPTVALYALGSPLSVQFGEGTTYPYSKGAPLQSRVLAARNWTDDWTVTEAGAQRLLSDLVTKPEVTVGFLPRQDYVKIATTITGPNRRGEPPPRDMPVWPTSPQFAEGPVDWIRQILFLKDTEAAGANYYLFRDEVSGGQPTEWTFWTMSERLGTAQAMADAEAALRDAPGAAIVETAALPQTDHYRALGQFGVDVEFYIASPQDTPRHTLRWGFESRITPASRFRLGEYQDLLHLRLPGDGAYYVALFPRRREAPIPQFATLGGGRIIRVSGEFGTDWGFLSAEPTEAQEEGVRFRGTAASVQDRGGRQVLSLGAAGAVAYGEWALEAELACSLRVLADAVVLELPADHQGGVITLRAPGTLRLHQPPPGAALSPAEGGFQLTVPAGAGRVVLAGG